MPRRFVPAVTFDLWHTLVYLRPAAEERYLEREASLAVGVLGLPARPDVDRRPNDLAARRAFDAERARAVSAAESGRSVPIDEQIRRIGTRVGRPSHPRTYRRRLRAELARTPFRLAPGARGVLRRLREDGFRVGVISNTVGERGEDLRWAIRRLGLEPLVDSWTFSDELPWTKPSPAIFRFALRGLGSAPPWAVHVGDGWSDIEGAKRAGLRGRVLFTGLADYGPNYRRLFAARRVPSSAATATVSDLRSLPALVRTLLPMRDGLPGSQLPRRAVPSSARSTPRPAGNLRPHRDASRPTRRIAGSSSPR